MNKQEIQAKIDSLNKKLENQNLSDYHKDFRDAIKTLEKRLENLGEATVDVVKPVKEAKPKTERKPRTPKVKTTTTTEKASDIEKAKAEIKRATGKTEEECEAIIEQYKALRAKSQERKKKEEQSSKKNQERIKELKKDDNVIPTTTEKNAPAVIETATEEVPEKIIKEMEVIEAEAEKEAVKEVEKEKPNLKPAEKKDAIKEKTEEKVKVKTEKVIERVTIDTSALLKVIAESLGKFDKDSQKEFLIKLRSDIDKLLSSFAFGGLTDGGVQVMNIQQSNLSSSSVNPTMFGGGGGVDDLDKYGTLHRGNEFIKYQIKDNGNYKVDFYRLEKIKGGLHPVACEKFKDCKFLDFRNVHHKELKEYISENNFFSGGGGVNYFPDYTGKKYEVINKKDKHYGEVGVSLHGWNSDKMGVKYLTLQFPNGSVDTYGEGEIQRILSGGGKIEYNEYGVPKGYLYLSEFANFDRKGTGKLTDVAETVLEDAFLEDQSEEGQQIHAYLHDLPHFIEYDNRIPRTNPESPENDEPMTDNYLLFLPIEDEDEAEENGGVIFHTFFVDTQGYDYPRYITRLVNYFPSDYQTEDLGYMARGARVKSGNFSLGASTRDTDLILSVYDLKGSQISKSLREKIKSELSKLQGVEKVEVWMHKFGYFAIRLYGSRNNNIKLNEAYDVVRKLFSDAGFTEDLGYKARGGMAKFTGGGGVGNSSFNPYGLLSSDPNAYSKLKNKIKSHPRVAEFSVGNMDGVFYIYPKRNNVPAEDLVIMATPYWEGNTMPIDITFEDSEVGFDEPVMLGEVNCPNKNWKTDEFIDWYYSKLDMIFGLADSYLESSEMARGGMTEHGLKINDRIAFDLNTINKKENRIVVSDEKGKSHYVDLDKGKRYSHGGNIHKNHKI